VDWHTTPTFAFTPNAGYHVDDVRVDGAVVSTTGANRYTFSAVTANHTISVAFAINPKPRLGTPICRTSVRRGKWFKVYGTLKPRFAARAKTVKVKAYRYANRKWRLYKTYAAVNANFGTFTKYTAKITIARKGKYRFKARTAATAQWAAAATRFSRTLTVK
jgi:hypothetical protein